MISTYSLRRRVATLEARRAARVVPAAEGPPPMDVREFSGRLVLTAAGYGTWRHKALTLEELLALAKDDASRASKPSEVLLAKEAAREIGIRIGVRDGRIDKEAANRLRVAPVSEDPPPALPYAVVMDNNAALASALAKCPRREELAVEIQLAMLAEDREHALLEERERQASYPPGAATPSSLEPMIERHYEWRVRELRARK